jgi:hypothetical protein
MRKEWITKDRDLPWGLRSLRSLASLLPASRRRVAARRDRAAIRHFRLEGLENRALLSPLAPAAPITNIAPPGAPGPNPNPPANTKVPATITGDPEWAYHFITVDVTPSGNYSVYVSGRTDHTEGTSSTFSPAGFSKLVIDPQEGMNVIDINATLAAVPVTIYTGSNNTGSTNDFVYIETVNNAGMPTIKGSVTITSRPTSGYESLSVDGTNDNGTHNVTLDTGIVTGLAQAPIAFDPAHCASLDLSTGKGGNTYTIKDTPNGVAGVATNIVPGGGQNTVNVLKTSGSLDIQSSKAGSPDNTHVTLGQPILFVAGPNPTTYSTIMNLHGAVDVEGSQVTINDLGDPNPIKNAILDKGSLKGFGPGPAPAPITWSALYVANLTILAGDGANTITVNNTDVPTYINAGAGKDKVYVTGTGTNASLSVVAVYPGATLNTGDTFNIGDNSAGLDNIKGHVTLNGAHSTVNVNDTATMAKTRSFTLSSINLTWSGGGAGTVMFSGVDMMTLNLYATETVKIGSPKPNFLYTVKGGKVIN